MVTWVSMGLEDFTNIPPPVPPSVPSPDNKSKFPNEKYSLNAVCDRFNINRDERDKNHGALIDAKLTAKVYLKMTHTEDHYGDQNVGAWKDDKQHGHGTYTYTDGDIYVGEQENDKAHGQGTVTYDAPHKEAGYKYVGEYKNGKRHGQGTLTFDAPHKFAGAKYVGE